MTTSFNFVAVAEDGIDWLQHLLFAGILWQIWLGWWWWVGSGMGIGEVEDLMEKAERKKRKAAKKAARQRALDRATGGLASRTRGSSLASGGAQAVAGVKGFTSSMGAMLRTRSSTLIRRNTARSNTDDAPTDEEHGRMGSDSAGARRGEEFELEDLGQARVSSPVTDTGGAADRDRPDRIGSGAGSAVGGAAGSGLAPRVVFTSPPGSRTNPTTNSETSTTSATPSLHIPRSVGQLFLFPTTWLQVYLRRLQHAHEDAARKQALQRAERREQVLARRPSRGAGEAGEAGPSEGEGDHARGAAAGGGGGGGGGVGRAAARLERGVVQEDEVGWGLGRFGILEQREGARRVQEARDRLAADRLLGPVSSGGEETSGQDPPPVRRRDHARQPQQQQHDGGGAGPESEWEDVPASGSGTRDGRMGRARQSRAEVGADQAGEQGEDVDSETDNSPDPPVRGRAARAGPSAGAERGSGRGWSWWGPLRDWRLNDRSTF